MKPLSPRKGHPRPLNYYARIQAIIAVEQSQLVQVRNRRCAVVEAVPGNVGREVLRSSAAKRWVRLASVEADGIGKEVSVLKNTDLRATFFRQPDIGGFTLRDVRWKEMGANAHSVGRVETD